MGSGFQVGCLLVMMSLLSGVGGQLTGAWDRLGAPEVAVVRVVAGLILAVWIG